MMEKIFSKRIFCSLAKEEEVKKPEQILGYFVGPCMVYMIYSGVAGTYLTQFYTDVLGISGIFLTLMPLLSKLLSGIIGIFLGRIIDKTRTPQGKARPWILCSGILITVCGFLLYAVPNASYPVQIAWIIVSYNLFFSIGFSIYSLSHSLMVPLSTREVKQRDSLAMTTSMATTMIPGALSTVIMPILVKHMGVGEGAQGSWLTVMSLLSLIAIPAVIIEYYFTIERVTKQTEGTQTVSFKKQVSACFHDKYWVAIMAFVIIMFLCSGLTTNSMLYYCNWVLASSVSDGAAKQILVNIIGQMPMGIGILALWPLVRKFGKRIVSVIGFFMAAAGCVIILFAGSNMAVVLGGLIIKSTGSLPTYLTSSYIAEALDHVERKNGFRADGFSASVNSIGQTTVMGLAQTILLFGINYLGYIAPDDVSQIITQSGLVRGFFSLCFAGIPLAGYIISAVIILIFGGLEKTAPEEAA